MRYERCGTYGIVSGGGPAVVYHELRLPDTGKFELEAWISNFGSSNVHIMRDRLSLTEAQNRLETNFNDMLMTLPSGAIGRCWLPESVNVVTVFFEAANTSGQAQLVTVRVVSRDE